jgi:hypothetical protein
MRDWQHAFPLDVLMVPSSALTVTAGGEPLSSGGFSLGETIFFESLEFITDYFSSLSVSLAGCGSEAVITSSERGGPPSS